MTTINLATYTAPIELDDSGLQRGLQNADKNIRQKAGGISSFLTKSLAGALTAVAGAGTAMFGIATKVSNIGDELDKTSQKMGVTTDALQELRFASGQVGVEQGNLDRALGRLNQRMGMAVDGNDKYASALTKLGVNMEDVRAGTVSTDQAFMQAIDSLNGMENAQQQSALASELFGTKLARDLMPMIQAGALEVDHLRDRAHELGGVMSGEAIDASVLFSDALDEVQTMLKGATVQIGAQLLPVMVDFLQWVQNYMPQIQATFQVVFNIMETLATGFVKTIGTLISWLKTWYAENEETLNAMRQSFSQFFETVKEFFSAFIEFVTTLWDLFGEGIIERSVIIFEAIQGVISGVFEVIEGLLKIFIGIFTGDWEKFTEGIQMIWQGLWNAINSIIAGAWNLLKHNFGKLYNNIRNWFTGLISDATNWGRDLVLGFARGIRNFAQNAVNEARNMARNVASTVTGFFGINSPSTLMAEYGRNLTDGLAKGVEDNRNSAINAIGSIASEMASQAQSAVDRVSSILSSASTSVSRSTSSSSGSSGGSSSSSSSGSSSSSRNVFESGFVETRTDGSRWSPEAGGYIDRQTGRIVSKEPEWEKYHEGGWVGRSLQGIKRNEVPALLEVGEYVLSRKMIRDIASASASGSNQPAIAGNTTQNFNISKLEFPNVKSSEDIEKAIKNLPRIAYQYSMGEIANGMRRMGKKY
ncbi:hypothetical protein GGQ84_001053 [Desulfitispora alkaliphila]|uniref:phage tail protein n=1 Tax=Desulfitispora alkaliphila TaxID=622674 RepID=UPI003D237494